MVEWLPRALSVSCELKRCDLQDGRGDDRQRRGMKKWHDGGDSEAEEEEEMDVFYRRWSLTTNHEPSRPKLHANIPQQDIKCTSSDMLHKLLGQNFF